MSTAALQVVNETLDTGCSGAGAVTHNLSITSTHILLAAITTMLAIWLASALGVRFALRQYKPSEGMLDLAGLYDIVLTCFIGSDYVDLQNNRNYHIGKNHSFKITPTVRRYI
jgi:hypothetical protein